MRAASSAALSALIVGPIDQASPHHPAALFASMATADSNERADSAGLKPNASTMPWST